MSLRRLASVAIQGISHNIGAPLEASSSGVAVRSVFARGYANGKFISIARGYDQTFHDSAGWNDLCKSSYLAFSLLKPLSFLVFNASMIV